MRFSDAEVDNHGDKLDLLMCLNQDTMDRHQRLMGPGTRIVYNSDSISPGTEDMGAELCGLPVADLTQSRNRLVQNTVGMAAVAFLMGIDFSVLEDSLTLRFQRRGQEMVDENVGVAKAGYEYAREHFKPFEQIPPDGGKPLAVWSGNEAMAMGGAAAGVKFYAAYPMSPATGVLHWMAALSLIHI